MDGYRFGQGTPSIQKYGIASGDVTGVGTGLPYDPETKNWPQVGTNRYGDIFASGNAQMQLGDVTIHNYNQAGRRKSVYDVLLASLTFEQMDSRLRSVESAMPSTCQWLFRHSKFLAWADSSADGQHQPLLWIKGKPGSGKSTIMKEMLTWIESAWSPETLVLNYFFNARSPDHLEKSTLGLFRCLLHQILTNCPASRDPFVKRFATKVSEAGHVGPWNLAELQNHLTELVKISCLPPSVIVIDALDEGDEDDVRQMVQYLRRLQQYARAGNSALRVAFSSRHYPNITIEGSLSLTVEGTPGHERDIDVYIRREMAHLGGPQFEDLKTRILHRSAGVFLWVVLVIPGLKKAYDKGKSFGNLVRKLEETPVDLHDVFSQIISRDSEDFDKCLKILAWVLFSVQPLSPAELYCAVEHTSDFDSGFTQTEDGVARYLLNCSRGLVELTHGRYPVVQFIHETVRDYLTSKGPCTQRASSYPVSRTFPTLLPQFWHMSIAEDCLRYLCGVRTESPSIDGITHRYPMSGYAANRWWRHVQLSDTTCNTQIISLASDFLTSHDSISRWIQNCGVIYKVGSIIIDRNGVATGCWLSYRDFYHAETQRQQFHDEGTAEHQFLVPPMYFAASVGILELVHHMLDLAASVNAACEPLGHPLTAAVCDGHWEIFQILLRNGADVNAQGGEYGNALQAASYKGSTEIVHILVEKGANVNAIGGQYRTALRAATTMRREGIVQLLLEHGAKTDDENEYYSPLQKAATLGHVGIARLLLSHGANVHKSGRFGSALTMAVKNRDPGMVKLLLEHGADPNEGYALHIAEAIKSEHLVQLLLNHGANKDLPPDADELPIEVEPPIRPDIMKQHFLKQFSEYAQHFPELEEMKHR